MEDVLRLLPVLLVAALMNIGAGMYYSIGTQNVAFDWKKLVQGILKAVIIGGIFVGAAYCFEELDLSAIGITPELIMTSAITIYVTKAVMSLCKILGVSVNNPKVGGNLDGLNTALEDALDEMMEGATGETQTETKDETSSETSSETDTTKETEKTE